MSVDHLIAAERETIINAADDIDDVRIWTCQRKVITALRKKSHAVTEVGSGFYGSTPWADFRVSTADVNWAGLIKRKHSPRPNNLANLSAPSPMGPSAENQAVLVGDSRTGSGVA